MTMNHTDLKFCGDVLTTALESGSLYWSEARNVERDENLTVISCEFRSDDEDDSKKYRSWRKVDRKAIHKAILKMMHGKIKVSPSIAGQFIGYPYNCDNMTNHDAEGADCALQVAIFGELVYGRSVSPPYIITKRDIEALRTEHYCLAEQNLFATVRARELIALIQAVEECERRLAEQREASNYMVCIHCAKKLPRATDAESLRAIYLEHITECPNSPIYKALADIEAAERIIASQTEEIAKLTAEVAFLRGGESDGE